MTFRALVLLCLQVYLYTLLYIVLAVGQADRICVTQWGVVVVAEGAPGVYPACMVLKGLQ